MVDLERLQRERIKRPLDSDGIYIVSEPWVYEYHGQAPGVMFYAYNSNDEKIGRLFVNHKSGKPLLWLVNVREEYRGKRIMHKLQDAIDEAYGEKMFTPSARQSFVSFRAARFYYRRDPERFERLVNWHLEHDNMIVTRRDGSTVDESRALRKRLHKMKNPKPWRG
jgi:GNAT superfamily N-acetyltransferase